MEPEVQARDGETREVKTEKAGYRAGSGDRRDGPGRLEHPEERSHAGTETRVDEPTRVPGTGGGGHKALKLLLHAPPAPVPPRSACGPAPCADGMPRVHPGACGQASGWYFFRLGAAVSISSITRASASVPPSVSSIVTRGR